MEKKQINLGKATWKFIIECIGWQFIVIFLLSIIIGFIELAVERKGASISEGLISTRNIVISLVASVLGCYMSTKHLFKRYIIDQGIIKSLNKNIAIFFIVATILMSVMSYVRMQESNKEIQVMNQQYNQLVLDYSNLKVNPLADEMKAERERVDKLQNQVVVIAIINIIAALLINLSMIPVSKKFINKFANNQ